MSEFEFTGQTKLKDTFLQMQSLPPFFILCGMAGCGKTYFVQQLAKHFKSDLYAIQDTKSADFRDIVQDGHTLSRPRIYLIEGADDLTPQSQSVLLKFIEESPKFVTVIFEVRTTATLLSTLLSRGPTYRFLDYEYSELLKFCEDDTLLSAFSQPGTLIRAMKSDTTKMHELAIKILDAIGTISEANTFNILHHFEESELDLVYNFIVAEAHARFSAGTHIQSSWAAMKSMINFRDAIESKSVNTRFALEMMFLDMQRRVSVCS